MATTVASVAAAVLTRLLPIRMITSVRTNFPPGRETASVYWTTVRTKYGQCSKCTHPEPPLAGTRRRQGPDLENDSGELEQSLT